MFVVRRERFPMKIQAALAWIWLKRTLKNCNVFFSGILDGYDAFVSTAKQVSDLVKPVEERHLLKFNLTWEFFNKALYENHIWISEPSMRNITGSFTTQVRNVSTVFFLIEKHFRKVCHEIFIFIHQLTKSRKRHSYQALFERYVAFVAEMMRVAELWPETERLIVKWKWVNLNFQEPFEFSKSWRFYRTNLFSDKQTADRGRASKFSPVDSSNVSSSTDILPQSQDKCEGSNEEEIAERTLRMSNSVSHPLSNGTRLNTSTEINGRDNFSSLSPITRGEPSLLPHVWRKKAIFFFRTLLKSSTL